MGANPVATRSAKTDLNGALGWWWADPVAGYLVAFFVTIGQADALALSVGAGAERTWQAGFRKAFQTPAGSDSLRPRGLTRPRYAERFLDAGGPGGFRTVLAVCGGGAWAQPCEAGRLAGSPNRSSTCLSKAVMARISLLTTRSTRRPRA